MGMFLPSFSSAFAVGAVAVATMVARVAVAAPAAMRANLRLDEILLTEATVVNARTADTRTDGPGERVLEFFGETNSERINTERKEGMTAGGAVVGGTYVLILTPMNEPDVIQTLWQQRGRELTTNNTHHISDG